MGVGICVYVPGTKLLICKVLNIPAIPPSVKLTGSDEYPPLVGLLIEIPPVKKIAKITGIKIKRAGFIHRGYHTQPKLTRLSLIWIWVLKGWESKLSLQRAYNS